MSSKKKRKSSCPFSNAKKTPKRKTSKAFSKEWAEALAASDKGSYFEQDKLLELDGPVNNEEDDAVPVVSASRLKLKGKCRGSARDKSRRVRIGRVRSCTRTSLKF